MTDKTKQHCTFCGKDQGEVVVLVAGPAVFICNECVDLCVEIVAANKFEAAVQAEVARREAARPIVQFDRAERDPR